MTEPRFLPLHLMSSLPHTCLPASGSTASQLVLLAAMGAEADTWPQTGREKKNGAHAWGGPGPQVPDMLGGKASSACSTSGLVEFPLAGRPRGQHTPQLIKYTAQMRQRPGWMKEIHFKSVLRS